MILFNAGEEDVDFVLPPYRRGRRWHPMIDTAEAAGGRGVRWSDRNVYQLRARSMAILRLGPRRG
jgi:hypothetical protein